MAKKNIRISWMALYLVAVLLAFMGPGLMPVSGIVVGLLLIIDNFVLLYYGYVTKWKQTSLSKKALGQAVSAMQTPAFYILVGVRALWGIAAVILAFEHISAPRSVGILPQLPFLDAGLSAVTIFYICLFTIAAALGIFLSSKNIRRRFIDMRGVL